MISEKEKQQTQWIEEKLRQCEPQEKITLRKEDICRIKALSWLVFNEKVNFSQDAEAFILQKDPFPYLLRLIKQDKKKLWEHLGEAGCRKLAIHFKDDRVAVAAIEELAKYNCFLNEKEKRTVFKYGSINVLKAFFQHTTKVLDEDWLACFDNNLKNERPNYLGYSLTRLLVAQDLPISPNVAQAFRERWHRKEQLSRYYNDDATIRDFERLATLGEHHALKRGASEGVEGTAKRRACL